jgi:hypothetical protein
MNNLDSNSIYQNAQRLDDKVLSTFIFKPIPSNLFEHNASILQNRQILIEQGNNKGNTKQLCFYKKILPKTFSSVQKEILVGLLLGDATLQLSQSGLHSRIKMQQSSKNSVLLYCVQQLFLPWMLSGVSCMKTRKIGNEFYELTSICHEAFNDLIPIFQKSEVVLKPSSCISKYINNQIQHYLSPLAIGFWFCCDGGKRDYGQNQGKAIQFHTQSFSQEENQLLADLLYQLYGWKVNVK